MISTEELARRVGAHGLRIFDCTTYLRPRPEGGYKAESGRADYDKAHVPGAALSRSRRRALRPNSELRFTLPPLDELTRRFAAKGVGHGTSSCSTATPADLGDTRLWMLRAIGFDDAAFLDGGFDKWRRRTSCCSTQTTASPPATLPLRGRPESSSTRTTSRPAISSRHADP